MAVFVKSAVTKNAIINVVGEGLPKKYLTFFFKGPYWRLETRGGPLCGLPDGKSEDFLSIPMDESAQQVFN